MAAPDKLPLALHRRAVVQTTYHVSTTLQTIRRQRSPCPPAVYPLPPPLFLSSRLSHSTRRTLLPSLPGIEPATSRAQRRRGVRVRALDSSTYWITAAQGLAVVFGIASSGVIVGVLLNYRLEKQSEAEVEALLAEGKTPEEILAQAEEEMRAQGLSLGLPDAEYQNSNGSQLLSGELAQGPEALTSTQQNEDGEEEKQDDPLSTAPAASPLSLGTGRRQRPRQRAD